MDTSKILLLLCCFVLIVCLTLSISTLVVLRNAIDENNSVQNDAMELVSELDGCVNDLNAVIQENSIPVSGTTADSKDILFWIRESEGKIAIYTADHYLIKVLDISVETLPPADREALSNGIGISSWQEALKLLQDYTS